MTVARTITELRDDLRVTQEHRDDLVAENQRLSRERKKIQQAEERAARAVAARDEAVGRVDGLETRIRELESLVSDLRSQAARAEARRDESWRAALADAVAVVEAS